MINYEQIKNKLEELNANFVRNINIFNQYVPNLYTILSNYKSKSELVINDKGEINILYQNCKLYPYEPSNYCQKQTQNFIKNPHFKIIIPTQSYNKTLPNLIFNRVVNNLLDILPINATEFVPYTFESKYINYIPLLLIVGVGLGYHIEYLIEHLNIKHVFIYEPELDFLYFSLYTINWEKIFKYFNKNNRSISINWSKNLNTIFSSVENINPIFFNNFLIYEHIFNKEAIDFFKERLPLLLKTFGYYDDEEWSLLNTIGNVKNKLPLYSSPFVIPFPILNKTKEQVENNVAFIIGAGPSLDRAIEIIKKYKDNAVIFSCGSSLRTLEQNGLIPDFHIEIERTMDTYESLIRIDKNYLKQITLITNNPIAPQVTSLFKETLMFLKLLDTGAELFGNNFIRLICTHPTVVNTGLEFVLHSGFTQIYLFGVDLGFYSSTYHHSIYNDAMDKGCKFYCEKIEDTIPVKGTFQDIVQSTSTFILTKLCLEISLSFFPQVKVFNCSDGAYIERTIPLRLEEINLTSNSFDKATAINLVKSQFSTDYLNKIDFNSNLINYLNRVITVIDKILTLIDKKIVSRLEIIDIFQNIYKELHSVNLIRGSILQLQHLIYSYTFGTNNEKKALLFINDSFKIVKEFLIEVKERAKILINNSI